MLNAENCVKLTTFLELNVWLPVVYVEETAKGSGCRPSSQSKEKKEKHIEENKQTSKRKKMKKMYKHYQERVCICLVLVSMCM